MRLLLAVGLLALAASTVAGLAALRGQDPPAEGGSFPVLVQGPDGPLFDDIIEAEAATALGALRATGLSLETQEYPGMGTYVRSIAGYRASGRSGWVYEVEREGTWRSGDRSAEAYTLKPGDAVKWSWTDG